jgi:hypothetical protein
VETSLAEVPSTILPELTTDESKLREALKEKKIRFVTDEQLKQMMLYIYALIGLRGENYPAGIDKDFLHTYIREYYGGHTMSEIRLAFTMAVQHKTGVDATAFEFFTTAYFSKIVDAYRKWAVETLHAVPAIIPAPALPPPETTDAEFIEGVKKMYLTSRNYKTIPVLAYKILEPEMKLTSEDKKRIYQYIHETTKEGDIKELSKQKAVAEYFDKNNNQQ